MLLVAIALLSWDATVMAAVDPAPRGSPQAVGEQIRWATGEFRKFTEALGLPESITAELTACEASRNASARRGSGRGPLLWGAQRERRRWWRSAMPGDPTR